MDQVTKLNSFYFKTPLNYVFNTSSNLSAIPSSNQFLLKADSGASQHYIRPQDCTMLQNMKDVSGPSVYLPDMTKITADRTGLLPIPHLSSSARSAHVFPNLKSASLLSLGQLCDDDCLILLNKY